MDWLPSRSEGWSLEAPTVSSEKWKLSPKESKMMMVAVAVNRAIFQHAFSERGVWSAVVSMGSKRD